MSLAKEQQILAQVQADLVKVEAFLAESLQTGSEDFNELIRPLSAAGGKRLRARLALLIAGAGESKESERVPIAAAIEMLHLATLIHDDVLDQAAVRRGVPAIHCSKGNKVAILSGDYLFAKAFDIVADVGSVAVLKAFSFIITSLVEGEFMQMEDVFKVDQGTDRYLTKTQKKTADFIEACMEIGGILGQWPAEQIEALKKYGHGVGMAFQITDDIMDYSATSETTGKPVGKDLREGLITYPLLSIVTEANKEDVSSYVHAIADGADENKLIDFVVAQGGVTNALNLEASYEQLASEGLADLPEFPGKSMLYDVLNSLAHRKV
ncbi:polyprenyl synthetase family protein [uncultured Veillonella sp.]|uniref:polyprenyl synthetase family protein n=1 Tax=uncultured Veillonella sp. TaxID=159268 RepID=UPI0025D7BDED|nr:polyprenyl synthetase family protein [uncultured Veillonella sp.]MDY3973527.1 polyprenyl synthetase family protein [Veillonella caviae]